MQGFKAVLAVSALALASTTGAAFAQTEIQWWHAMDGANGERINAMAEQFNAQQSDYKVVPTYKGSYPETLSAAIAAFRAGQPPHIVQVFEVGTATFMNAKGAVKPVHQLMAETGEPFDPNAFLAAVTGYYTSNEGEMLSLPFNSSTPVLYYNKDIFEKAGLDPNTPPKTWEEVGEFTKKIIESGAAPCGYTTTWPSWVHLENLSARHGQSFASQNNGFGGLDAELLVTGPLFVKQISTLGEWQKTKQFDYGGRGSKGKSKFISGECGIMTESSAGYGSVVSGATFDWGISQLPYWESEGVEPSNSIIGGASLWVLGGHDAEEYTGVAKFFNFLSSPEVQAKWHQETGYLPITPAAYELSKSQGFYEANPGTDTAIIQMNPMEPAKVKGIRLGNFVQIRDIIDEELEKVWAGQATAEQALQAIKQRGDAELRKFEATAK